MQSLTEYMKKELVFYIKQEHDKGVPISQIKRSLLDGGHHANLVKEAMKSLRKHKYNLVKALNEPISSNLDKELYFNIMNSLIKYAEYQLASGKSVADVKKILSNYGHSKDVIEKAINSVNKQEEKTKPSLKYAEFSIILGVFLLIFFTAGSAKEPLEMVALGFLPSIAVIITLNFAVTSKRMMKLFWIYPVIFPGLFLALGLLDIFSEGFDYFKLTFLNLGLSLLYTYVKSARVFNIESMVDKIEESVATSSDKEADNKENKSKSNGKKKKK